MIPPEGALKEIENRDQIAHALFSSGWLIQDKKCLNQQVRLCVSMGEADFNGEN